MSLGVLLSYGNRDAYCGVPAPLGNLVPRLQFSLLSISLWEPPFVGIGRAERTVPSLLFMCYLIWFSQPPCQWALCFYLITEDSDSCCEVTQAPTVCRGEAGVLWGSLQPPHCNNFLTVFCVLCNNLERGVNMICTRCGRSRAKEAHRAQTESMPASPVFDLKTWQ